MTELLLQFNYKMASPGYFLNKGYVNSRGMLWALANSKKIRYYRLVLEKETSEVYISIQDMKEWKENKGRKKGLSPYK